MRPVPRAAPDNALDAPTAAKARRHQRWLIAITATLVLLPLLLAGLRLLGRL